MRKIVVIDGDVVPNPEDVAMLQALYSRSTASVTDHLEKVRRVGSGRFLDNYLIGYGHKSIGDCGTTTIFIENVSMLAVKAVQDNPLYAGQETSTRYIDMAARPLVDPVGSEVSGRILKMWMHFYTGAQEEVAAHIRERYPRGASEDATLYEKAVKARVFDILRGFLPAAMTTQFSWHGNLRQIGDKLPALLRHPLVEVRALGADLRDAVRARYEHSFDSKVRPEQEAWRSRLADLTYYDPTPALFPVQPDDVNYLHISNNLVHLSQHDRDVLAARPPRAELPYWMNELGTLTFYFLLDFGSWRDLQRHRSGVRRVPLLSRRWGFHRWYINELPETLQRAASDLLRHQMAEIAHLGCDPAVEQYYLPFGMLVPCVETWGLPALCYITDLRSTKFVHPTLRTVVQRIARWTMAVPEIPLQADFSPDDWNVRRGQQDIVARSV